MDEKDKELYLAGFSAGRDRGRLEAYGEAEAQTAVAQEPPFWTAGKAALATLCVLLTISGAVVLFSLGSLEGMKANPGTAIFALALAFLPTLLWIKRL